MPFKSDKQRKWMYANEPEMAKKWEKEESIREKIRGAIKQEIKSINEGWWEDLSDKAQAAYIKKHGEAPKSSGKKEDEMGDHIRKGIAKDKKGQDKRKKLNRDWDAKTSTASDIAKDMGGNMTGAVKKIEKIKKGLSNDPKVKAALRKANESVNEDNIKFSKEEMAQLHKDGKVEKNGHTIEFGESINEGFDKYYLSSLLDSNLKKKLEIAIKKLKGKVDGIGDDWIWFRMPSHNLDLLTQLITKLDKNKNVWIGDKRKKNIWDRRRNIDKLGESQILRAKQMVLLPDKKMYFDPMSNHLWLMGPYGGPDLDDDPIEPRDRDYNKIIRKLSSKDKSVLKKAMRTRKRRKEATTSVSVPVYLSPQAFSKSTQNAIDVDDEDDEKNESINERKLSSYQKKAILIAIEMSGNMTGAVKKIERIKRGLSNDKKVKDALRLANESMAAPFRRRKSRGLGRPMKVGINESDLGLTYKKGKTVKVTHKKSGKELVIIDKPNVKREYEKIGYFAEGTVNELQMAPFSSQEARSHINSDIKDMSKLLGKTSQQVIKIMMDGVRKGKYTAMDISRGIKEGPAQRTHFGEMTFIQSLWTKMRDKFRRYSKDRKLS